MNNTYQKKPIQVQAFQMTRERRMDNSEWPEWLHAAWNKTWGMPGYLGPATFLEGSEVDQLMIDTLEGVHLVGWDDYIIQGIKGELYPCKADIFEATYDKVN